MAKLSHLNTRLYLNQYNWSGNLNAIDFDVTQETPDVTTFSDTGPRRVVGNYDFKASANGFFEAGTLTYDGILKAWIPYNGVDTVTTFAFCPGANTEGSRAYQMQAKFDTAPISVAVGGAVLRNFTLSGSGGVGNYKTLVIANMTSTGAENRTGRSLGTSAAGQTFEAHYRVPASTVTNFTIEIQESDDDAAGDPYATIAGMTVVCTTKTAGVLSTTAATKLWKRVAITTWVGTSAEIFVTAGTVA